MLLSSHWPIAASGAPLGDLFGCDSEALPFRLVLSPNPERASLLISGVGALSRWLTGNAKLLPVLSHWIYVFNGSVIVNFILYLIAGGPGDAREPLLLCGAARSLMLIYPICSVGLGFGVLSALPWTPFVDIAPIVVIMIFDFLFIKILFIHLFLNYFFYSSSFSVRRNIRFIWETRLPLLGYFSLC